jgi:Transglutaminase elicitor
MSSAAVALLFLTAAVGQVSSSGGTITPDELAYQQQAFKQWWEQDLVLKLADLPAEGKTPDFRIPYAGHDYPDKRGGTIGAMRKYDAAFGGGKHLAEEYERKDVGAHRGRYGFGNSRGDEPPRGLLRNLGRGRTPGWYGHCNGWTAAAIRHAEPEKSVIRNGVEFTPADIKGMLAEMYMYSPTEFLGGVDASINPATLHLVLTNWIGRGSHPVGMESALGEVVINYPIYAYKATMTKISDQQSEVKMMCRYTLNTPQEHQKGPKTTELIYFHYTLDLDKDGVITGGRYHGDTQMVDMLWTPLKPVQGGEKGNERGNPHMDIKEVLAIWRESVSAETRKQWLNVDPVEEDRVVLEDAKPKTDDSKPKVEDAKPAATASE